MPIISVEGCKINKGTCRCSSIYLYINDDIGVGYSSENVRNLGSFSGCILITEDLRTNHILSNGQLNASSTGTTRGNGHRNEEE
jgi:hypothetical protein